MNPQHVIGNFLASPPKGAVDLQVIYDGIAEEVVHTVARSDVGASSMEAAEALITLCQEDTNLCRTDEKKARYFVRWLDDAGRVLSSKKLVFSPMRASGRARALQSHDFSQAEGEDGELVGQHPYIAVLSEALSSKTKTQGAHLKATIQTLNTQSKLLEELLADKRANQKALLEQQKESNRVMLTLVGMLVANPRVNDASAEGDDCAVDQAKAVAIDKFADAALAALLPPLAKIAEGQADRLLQSQEKKSEDKAPNGKAPTRKLPSAKA